MFENCGEIRTLIDAIKAMEICVGRDIDYRQ